jgi:hypothetical protein
MKQGSSQLERDTDSVCSAIMPHPSLPPEGTACRSRSGVTPSIPPSSSSSTLAPAMATNIEASIVGGVVGAVSHSLGATTRPAKQSRRWSCPILCRRCSNSREVALLPPAVDVRVALLAAMNCRVLREQRGRKRTACCRSRGCDAHRRGSARGD